MNAADEVNVGSDLAGNEIFGTLAAGLAIPPPATGTLLTGFRHALETAWANEFPDHPDLGAEEVRLAKLTEAVALATRAVEQGGRMQGLTAQEQRVAREIITALELGTVNENVLVVDTAHFKWGARLARWEAELGGECTVGGLRTKFAPWGMTAAMQDTILIVWSLLDNREFGGGATPQVGSIPDGATPRRANLPEENDWGVAKARSGAIFGVAPEANLTPRAVARWATALRNQANASKVHDLVAALQAHAGILGIDPKAVAGRLATARRVVDVVNSISAETADSLLVKKLATLDLPDVLTSLGTAHASAERLSLELVGLDWGIIEAARSRNDPGFDAALLALQEAARLDESVMPLESRLRDVAAMARALIVQPQPVPVPTPAPATHPEHTRKAAVADLDEVLEQLQAEIEAEAGASGSVTITWQIDES